ncbi:MAG: aminodeoxychorismate synthase component I [Brachybacterium tyrofermentans]
MRTVLIDNYDSYSYNLFQLMAATCGEEPLVLANDAPEWAGLDLSEIHAAVVSPGPGTPEVPSDRGDALEHLTEAGIPILGVCFGHQALGWICGAAVVAAPRPRHGHVETIRHSGEDLFRGIPQEFAAVRYHSLCLTDPLPEDLEATAWATDEVIMAVRHRTKPWWGVQFHPESVATEHGAALMANFAELARIHGTDRPAERAGDDRRARTLRRRRLEFTVPTEVLFDELFAHRKVAFWLDSSKVEHGLSRYSFLGDSGGPLGEVLQAHVGTGTVEVRNGDDEQTPSSQVAGSIFDLLDARLRDAGLPWDPGIPFDLASGYVGYFGYELKAENGSPNRHASAQPDALWMLATRMLAVDHQTGQTWVLALADATDESIRSAQRWVDQTAATITALRGRTVPPAPADEDVDIDISPLLDRPRERYLADIEECLRQLRAGESYEICLTNLLDTPFEGSALEAYRRLRRRSPAPYAAYLRFGDLHILCSSPERYLKIDPQGVVESKPIKGTAPRDPDPATDDALRVDLARSEKTRAENLMIVDLLRNDLGRICEIGSVRVPGFMDVESYATVHQLVSTVRGRLKSGLSPIDAVRASFPGGSMTGAPKLRTMQIIQGLEEHARGIYSGTLGFLGLQGAADLNIVIRTAVIDAGRATIGAGGAIVLDSDPTDEYDEMALKAAAVIRAVVAETAAAAVPTRSA